MGLDSYLGVAKAPYLVRELDFKVRERDTVLAHPENGPHPLTVRALNAGTVALRGYGTKVRVYDVPTVGVHRVSVYAELPEGADLDAAQRAFDEAIDGVVSDALAPAKDPAASTSRVVRRRVA